MSASEHLTQLEKAGLIRLDASGVELEYLFRHVLLQNAAYETLLKVDRRHLHRIVAETLERVHADRLDELAGVLARHFHEAGDARAAGYYARAGAAAFAHMALAEAEAAYSAALQLTAEGDATRSGLWRARAQVRDLRGDFEGARADGEAALAGARARGERPEEWETLLMLGLLWAARDYVRAGEYWQAALDLAHTFDDPARLARSLNRVGNWHANLDRPDVALTHHREALALFLRLEDDAGLAETYDLLSMAESMGNDLIASTEHVYAALPLFRAAGNTVGVISALASFCGAVPCIAFPASVLPEISVATVLAASDEALGLARQIGWRAGEAYVRFAAALIHTASGSYRAARLHSEMALEIAEEIGHTQWQVGALLGLSLLALDTLDWRTAARYGKPALDLAHAINSQHWIVSASAGMVHVLIGQKKHAEAVAVVARAGCVRPSTGGGSSAQRALWYAAGEQRLASGDAAGALEWAEWLYATGVPQAMVGVRTLPYVVWLRARANAALRRDAEARADFEALQVESLVQYRLAPLWWRVAASRARFMRARRRAAEAEQAAAEAQAIVARLALELPDEAARAAFVRRAQRLSGGA